MSAAPPLLQHDGTAQQCHVTAHGKLTTNKIKRVWGPLAAYIDACMD